MTTPQYPSAGPQPPISPPPQAYPPLHLQRVQPPRTRRDWWLKGPGLVILIPLVGALLLGPLMLLGELGDKAEQRTVAQDIRVQVTSCEMTDLTASVGLAVTNSGDRPRSVQVSVEYRDAAGRRVDTDTAHVRNVPAGDTVAYEESTILDAPAGSGGTCAVVGIR